MNVPHKLQVRIGDFEFSAEGSEKAVEQQYARFLKLIEAGARTPKEPEKPRVENNHSPPPPSHVHDAAKFDRLFAKDANDRISLRILPRTDNRDADALLLLLIGYAVCAGKKDIGSTSLMISARQSGLQLDRLDKTLAVHQQYLTEGGYRRGKKYGLNNQGISRATEIINGMAI